MLPSFDDFLAEKGNDYIQKCFAETKIEISGIYNFNSESDINLASHFLGKWFEAALYRVVTEYDAWLHHKFHC